MWSDGEDVSTPSCASMAAFPFVDQLWNAEVPTFSLRYSAFRRRQVWIEECGEAGVPVGAGEVDQSVEAVFAGSSFCALDQRPKHK